MTQDGLWSGILSPEEVQVYDRLGYWRTCRRPGLAPGLVLVDLENNFTGDRPEPILDSIRRYRYSCGVQAWESLPRVRRLLEASRAAGLPVIYTRGAEDPPDPTPDERRDGRRIVDVVAPVAGERVFEKRAASAFYAGGFLSHLIHSRVDTLLVCGCTTSGCVRATVVDSVDHGFRTVVVAECVFDRAALPHRVNLFDMAAKYAAVWSLDETLAWLRAFHGEARPPAAGALTSGTGAGGA
ncbi:MAG TPA: isochorismatase family protein [bacterium]|nr:isochorismatase family protein [bacterium]